MSSRPPEIVWPHELQTRRVQQAHCNIYFDFDWKTVFGHNRATFRGCQDLTQTITGFASKRNREPYLVLTDKHDVPFHAVETDDHFVAIVNIEEFKKLAQGTDRSALFFLTALNAMSSLGGDPSLRVNQLLVALDAELDGQGQLLVQSLNLAGSRVIGALLSASIKALEGSATRESLLALAHVFDTEEPTILEELALVTRRRKTIADFERELQNKAWTEQQWQDFFEANIWILGHGTDYLFGALAVDQAYVRPPRIDGKGARKADFLLQSVGAASFTRIVEIKLPQARLLKEEYRNGIWLLDKEVVGGVSQTLAYCRNWEQRAIESARIVSGITVRPHGILVIGELASIRSNEAAIETFEEFRQCQHGMTILCYDELLERAKHMTSAGRIDRILNQGS